MNKIKLIWKKVKNVVMILGCQFLSSLENSVSPLLRYPFHFNLNLKKKKFHSSPYLRRLIATICIHEFFPLAFFKWLNPCLLHLIFCIYSLRTLCIPKKKLECSLLSVLSHQFYLGVYSFLYLTQQYAVVTVAYTLIRYTLF